MGTVRTDEFRKDAVRIALTSGLSRKQIADDLGVGMATLNKWITAHRDTDVVSQENRELALENERLRREELVAYFLTSYTRPSASFQRNTQQPHGLRGTAAADWLSSSLRHTVVPIRR